MTARRYLLVSTALAFGVAAPAAAQDPAAEPPPPSQPAAVAQPAAAQPIDEFDEDDIVVTGQRRGIVIGDIPPENVLNARDIRATGATSISELLEAIAPQIGSARGRGGGGRPIMLLDGQRVSGFRELRDIPTEAILRVEVLPEEVALKYGFRADQRVVNIVLRPRFRSTVAAIQPRVATEGGYAGGNVDLTRLMIGDNGRTTINLRAEGNSMLTEAERDIALRQPIEPGARDRRTARSLLGSRRLVRGAATVNRTVLGDVSATVNAELEHSEGRSLIGLDEALLGALERQTSSDSAGAGFALNWVGGGGWRWSATGNGELVRSVTETDRTQAVTDRARTNRSSGTTNVTANGRLFALPAGDAGVTFRVGASALHLDSERRRLGVSSSNSLGRTAGSASANFDLPVSRRDSDLGALGNLTLNANAELEQLSDFGSLVTYGAGANWSPVDRLNLIASWTREEGAPSVQQLGDPILETPGSRVFDFTRGETVLVTAITGGNPDLLADKRNVLKLGGNWRPLEQTDLRLRAEYVRSRLDRPVSGLPGASAALEAAFPDRFVRNADGELTGVDLRPVNFDGARRDTLRWGFDFTRPLRSSPPSPETIQRLRERAAAMGIPIPQRPRGADGTPQGRPGGGPGGGGPSGGQGFRFGGGPGGGMFGGGQQGGRLTFSLTHTANLVDEVTIRDGLPRLDYLRGEAVGQFGGRPRHELEARAGWMNNGLGAFTSANWRGGTRVDTAAGESLRFSPLATFDLRLFANLGERLELVTRHPWMRGSSVRLEVNNLLDSKPRVRDSAGDVPFGYQADLLDPLGRTVSVTFRKLFLPPPRFFRQQMQRRQQEQAPPAQPEQPPQP